MRVFPLLAACAVLLCAQVPEVEQAEAEVRRIEQLVEAGAAPRAAVDKARTALEEARDHGILRATLYGQVEVEQLTEEQASQMVAAAERNLARKQEILDSRKKLVDEGVLARTALTPFVIDLDDSRRVFDLARSRGRLFRDLAEIARSEEEVTALLDESPREPLPMVHRYDGDGVFQPVHLRMAVLEFEREFRKALPISARGETALHRSLGYDHRGRVDVAVSPDSKEGAWLSRFLESMRVPYYAFRGRVAGKSTAAHFHIGPPSLRLRRAD